MKQTQAAEARTRAGSVCVQPWDSINKHVLIYVRGCKVYMNELLEPCRAGVPLWQPRFEGRCREGGTRGASCFVAENESTRVPRPREGEGWGEGGSVERWKRLFHKVLHCGSIKALSPAPPLLPRPESRAAPATRKARVQLGPAAAPPPTHRRSICRSHIASAGASHSTQCGLWAPGPWSPVALAPHAGLPLGVALAARTATDGPAKRPFASN